MKFFHKASTAHELHVDGYIHYFSPDFLDMYTTCVHYQQQAGLYTVHAELKQIKKGYCKNRIKLNLQVPYMTVTLYHAYSMLEGKGQ